MEKNPTSQVTTISTPPNKKKKPSKKKRQQNSNQQDNSASRPGTSSGLDEVVEDERPEMQGERTDGSSSAKQNSKPPVTNGRASQHINGDNSDDDFVDDTTGLRDELEKEKMRSQVLERQLASLRKDLIEKSKSVEATASVRQEELLKEKAKSQELEKTIQELRSELSQIPTMKDTTTQGKLQELVEQLDAQRTEIDGLRKSLSNEQDVHRGELAEADQKLATVQKEKQQLDTQYKTLIGRVSHIKTTLGDKLKSDAEELDRTREMVDNLEDENRSLGKANMEFQAELEKANEESDRVLQELSTLRNRMNFSQQNWAKERNDLIHAERFAREEYEAAKQAMQEWEVIATEERAVRESTGDRVIELEEQVNTQQTAFDMVLLERERESNKVNGLQRALQDIQDAHKAELREVVEGMEAQIKQLTLREHILEKRAREAEAQLSSVQQDLKRVLPFEKEVKEKNLLIGKLRHEAVTLNDHLRKALRMLKRDNADDKIDKQLVTNVFLQFVSIQRGDSKKYEILQLIASVLDWSDEQREKAGLVRPGTAASSQGSFLKTPPLSPFHRSPSTPTLSDAYEGSRDIWTSVLDSEKS